MAMWNGLKSIFIYGVDSKANAAIIHGVSQLSPSPRVELCVGEMRMAEFKSLFRLRNGKLQPGTELRLITRKPADKPRLGSYLGRDEDAETYWTEMEEEVAQVVGRHGIKTELSTMPLYERIFP
jgi:hypothetical protein